MAEAPADVLVRAKNKNDRQQGDQTSKQKKEGKAAKKKVEILLKATGSAPIIAKEKWAIDPQKKVTWVIDFIRRYLKCEPSQSLFLYVNQAFAPAPDQEIGNLCESYGSDGKLILHYCMSEAWG